ncbi:MAG TPA: hypothetical protein VFE36_03120 [Candidatus Baltobacteraceae bacterium]|nr:hypothetical protein [Candidatus Baltobacteraceae bacterium]
MINSIDIWVIVLLIAAMIVVCGEVGFRIGAGIKMNLHESPYGVLQAAIFGLLALLIAFSFSLGLARYDARRESIVSEADAIRVVMRRSELLDEKRAVLMRGYLSRYVDARVGFAGEETDYRIKSDALQRSATLQRQMWNVAITLAGSNNRPEVLRLFVEALDRMFEQGDDVEAIFSAHIPDAVVYVLVIVMAFASVLLGIGFGRTDRRGTAAVVSFALVLALVVGANIDLDHPQRGFIRVSLEPLQSLHQLFAVTTHVEASLHH